MLLAVTPLPSPLTTPPETKTYFIAGATSCDTVAPNCSKQAEEARASSCQSIGLQVGGSPSTAALVLNVGTAAIPTSPPSPFLGQPLKARCLLLAAE